MFIRLFLVLIGLYSISAHAILTIEITSGVDNPTPIAIVPFGGSAGLPEDMQSIIANDFQYSGLFKVIPKTDMLSFPTSADKVFYRDWRALGANYILIGNLVQVETGYLLNYELFDVLLQKSILTERTAGSPTQLRDMAHTVSDKVFEKITGIRGVFSTKIIYVQDMRRAGKDRYRLVLADADGARERTIVKTSEPMLSPAWSNDGKKVAYVSFETGRPAIYIQELASGKREQVTNFRGLNGAPAWSPDDKSLAMVLSKDGNPEIYTLNLITKRFRRITNTNPLTIDTEPNWSADGRSIIFTSNRGGKPQIYRVGLASGRVERLTFYGDYNARPRLTPDGEGLVMVHRNDGVFHIALQHLKTGDIRVLTETLLDESPSIAPNGAMLMYATQYGGKGVLGAVSMDAGIKFRLPSKQGDVREPAWSPYLK